VYRTHCTTALILPRHAQDGYTFGLESVEWLMRVDWLTGGCTYNGTNNASLADPRIMGNATVQCAGTLFHVVVIIASRKTMQFLQSCWEGKRRKTPRLVSRRERTALELDRLEELHVHAGQ
jgi:hypothetical protein